MFSLIVKSPEPASRFGWVKTGQLSHSRELHSYTEKCWEQTSPGKSLSMSLQQVACWEMKLSYFRQSGKRIFFLLISKKKGRDEASKFLMTE